MAILELKAEIPDLFERIEKALSEQKFELKDVTFHDGVFVSADDRLKGILGYDSGVRLRLVYTPTVEIPDFDNPENIKIASTSHAKILECNYDLHQVDGNLLGKVKFSQNNPLILDVIVSSDHLKAPPYQGEMKRMKHPKSRTSDELVKIVKELGLEDKRNATDEERRDFRFEDMLSILEWIKLNMRYTKQKENYLEALREREGVCEQFSEIFERMVYIAGGFSFHIPTHTFNLPLEGWNYFSINPSPLQSHALTGVYYDGEWYVVDPTIYNTTYHNLQIPEGHEKRAYSPMVGNYHIVEITQPVIQFLDRNLLKSGTDIEKEKLKIMIERGENPCVYKTLMPRVDKQSICLLK